MEHLRELLIFAKSSLTRAALKQSLPLMAASQKPARASSQEATWPLNRRIATRHGAFVRVMGRSLTSVLGSRATRLTRHWAGNCCSLHASWMMPVRISNPSGGSRRKSATRHGSAPGAELAGELQRAF
eukprot:6899438-Pyramimonas_sp.AAC.1